MRLDVLCMALSKTERLVPEGATKGTLLRSARGFATTWVWAISSDAI